MLSKAWGTVVIAISALGLSACGGGGGLTESADPGDGSTPGRTEPGSLVLLADKPTLMSGDSSPGIGTDGVTLTAFVKDVNNNVMGDQIVTFSATAGALTGTTGGNVKTGPNGQAQTKLYTGGDPLLRTINVTARVGTRSSTITIPVAGNTLVLDGPATAVSGNPVTYTARLQDSTGRGIGNVAVNFTATGATPASGSLVTASDNGAVAFELVPNNTQTTVTVAAAGLQANRSTTVTVDDFQFLAPAANAEIPLNNPTEARVRWRRNVGGSNTPVPDGSQITVRSSRGTVTAATQSAVNGEIVVQLQSPEAGLAQLSASGKLAGDGPNDEPRVSITRSVEFVALPQSARELDLQAARTVVPKKGSTSVTATVLDENGNPVKSALVQFSVAGVNSGTIEPAQARTDADGRAFATYTARDSSSAQDGITVTAVMQVTDTLRLEDSVKLTVVGESVSVVLGTGNKLEEINNGTAYRLPYHVLVTDASGAPAAGAVVKVRAWPLTYYKGQALVGDRGQECSNEDVNRNFRLDTEDANGNGQLDPGEDANGNGRLDTEDRNGNGLLDPQNVAAATGGTNGDITVDETGFGNFFVVYAKDKALWIDLELSASTTVNGTEGRSQTAFNLPMLEADANNPPNGGRSIYGVVADCSVTD